MWELKRVLYFGIVSVPVSVPVPFPHKFCPNEPWTPVADAGFLTGTAPYGLGEGADLYFASHPSLNFYSTLMAYFHQRRWTRIRTPFPMVTLYYAELFPLVWIGIPVRRVSWMVTVPILGTDLHPRDRSPSLFHTFESGDQSLNPNQWKNLHSTRIRVRIWVRIRVRWWK